MYMLQSLEAFNVDVVYFMVELYRFKVADIFSVIII
jgi:hypothetical protein